MDSRDTDHLLEEGLSGDPPSQGFRSRVLRDSTAAFVQARRSRVWWRPATLSAAAVLIAVVSFLLGRGSAPGPATGPAIAGTADTVTVPTELVVWLDAARLFGQLGMEDRMARAVERAGRLLPVDVLMADTAAPRVFAAASSIGNREERVEPMGMPGPNPSVQSVNQILAQAFGD
jgi:hypothetical protein